MPFSIIIGHDHFAKHADGNPQSFSAEWQEHARRRGIAAEVIDPMKPGALERIRGADAFMWRYNFQSPWIDVAPRLMNAVEDGLGIPVWPPRPMRATFEDKIAQSYMLESLGIPHPKTWVFWREEEAMAALGELPFPLVAKLSRGIKSRGVALIRDRREAERLIRRMFSFGQSTLNFTRNRKAAALGKYSAILRSLARGRIEGHLERNYVLFQEFIPGADRDTRLCIQGNRAFATTRLNREQDFRASGSGVTESDPALIDPAAIELGFDFARRLGVDCLVLDILQKDGRPCIGEYSHTSALYVARICGGHWLRDGSGALTYIDRPVDWAAAIFDDFTASIEARAESHAA